MKKIYLFIICLVLFPMALAHAQSMVSKQRNLQQKFISYTSFPDYFPFSQGKHFNRMDASLTTVFDPVLEALEAENNYVFTAKPQADYTEAVANVRQGKTDIILGIYTLTKLYAGIDFVYPAVMHNPIHVIFPSDTAKKPQNESDLDNLNGAYIATEHFNDFMLKNFTNHNIKPIASADEAYEQLLTGRIDYIIGSYYFNYAYTVQTGLRPFVGFSKQPLWNIPMFIGVSKASSVAVPLTNVLTRFLQEPRFKELLEKSIQDTMQQLEEDSRGVVPPKFVRAESLTEQTPADEQPITYNTQE